MTSMQAKVLHGGGALMARVEILHVRDPDSACGVRVWLDGVEVDADVVDVDPGRGYSREDWDESHEHEVHVEGRSGLFAVAIDEAFREGAENKYIRED